MTVSLEIIQHALVLYAGKASVGNKDRYYNPTLCIKKRFLPVRPSPGMVRLEMSYIGICGTDLDLVTVNPATEQIISSAPMTIGTEGRIIGHEGIGMVMDAGDNQTNFSIGDWAVPSSVLNCGCCHPCLTGMPNQCLHAQLLGTQIDGLFADIVDVPGKLLVNVSGHIKKPEDIYAFTALEPAATSLQACERGFLKNSDRIIVFGAGPIGAYCAMIAKSVYGCHSITIVEPSVNRRKKSAAWANELYASASEIDISKQYDVLIEASGHLSNVTQIFARLNPGARIILLARSGEPLIFDHVDHMITNAISITGCRGQLGGYMNRIADLYSEGVLPLGTLLDCAGLGVGDIKKSLENSDVIRKTNCKSIVKFRQQG